jgi:hypothetical protein
MLTAAHLPRERDVGGFREPLDLARRDAAALRAEGELLVRLGLVLLAPACAGFGLLDVLFLAEFGHG